MKHICQIWPYPARSGALTLKAEDAAGKTSFLHSLDDPEKEAGEWLKKIKLAPNTAYLVFGFGLGYHVKKLLAHLPVNSKIFVIEYSVAESLVKASLELLPDKSWLCDKRLVYLAISDLRAITGAVVEHMRADMLSDIVICRHQPTMNLFREFYALLEKKLVPEIIELISFNVAFAIRKSLPFLKNCWSNLPFIAKSGGNTLFKGKFAQVPAIIVSSGPSLNKNLHLIKELNLTEKAVIIACTSTVRALKKNKITPHFMAVADPVWVSAESIAETAPQETILLATYDASSGVVAGYPGSRIFCVSTRASFLGDLLPHLPSADFLPVNGSVATMAFEFAGYIGADPIIFMGQDLAFSEEHSHADGVSENSFVKTDDPAGKYLWVKGENGQLLKTVKFYDDVREYFVSRIKVSCQNKIIINATEGGAYIDGAQHMPLAAAAAKYLTRPVAVKEKTDAVLKTFTPPDKRQLIEAVKNTAAAAKEAAAEIELFNKQMFAGIYSSNAELAKEEMIIAECQKFYDALRLKPLYLYLKYYLDSVYLLQTLEHRHGCPLAKQIDDWTNLLRETKKTLALLHQISAASLALLEKD